jgi:hypothetical protein
MNNPNTNPNANPNTNHVFNEAFHKFVEGVAVPIAKCRNYPANAAAQRLVRGALGGMLRSGILAVGVWGIVLAGTNSARADILPSDISRAINSKDASGYVRLGDKVWYEAQRAMQRAQQERDREEARRQREAERQQEIQRREAARQQEIQRREAERQRMEELRRANDPNAELRAQIRAEEEYVRLMEQKKRLEERKKALGMDRAREVQQDTGVDLNKLRAIADQLEAEHGFSKASTSAAHILPGNILGLKHPNGYYVLAGQTGSGEVVVQRVEVDNPSNPLMSQVAKFRHQIETMDMGQDIQ